MVREFMDRYLGVLKFFGVSGILKRTPRAPTYLRVSVMVTRSLVVART